MENKSIKFKPTREKIVEAISTYTRSYGYSPTIRELCEMTGIKSTSTIHGHLKRLERKGIVRRETDMPRTTRVLVDDFEVHKVGMNGKGPEIIKCLGMLSDHLDMRLREINLVRLKGEEVGYDIRTFAADYKCEDEGITLTANEAKRLKNLLNGIEL